MTLPTSEESLAKIAHLLESVIGQANSERAGLQPRKSADGTIFRYPLQSGGYIIERFRDGHVEVEYEDLQGDRHRVMRRRHD